MESRCLRGLSTFILLGQRAGLAFLGLWEDTGKEVGHSGDRKWVSLDMPLSNGQGLLGSSVFPAHFSYHPRKSIHTKPILKVPPPTLPMRGWSKTPSLTLLPL